MRATTGRKTEIQPKIYKTLAVDPNWFSFEAISSVSVGGTSATTFVFRRYERPVRKPNVLFSYTNSPAFFERRPVPKKRIVTNVFDYFPNKRRQFTRVVLSFFVVSFLGVFLWPTLKRLRPFRISIDDGY